LEGNRVIQPNRIVSISTLRNFDFPSKLVSPLPDVDGTTRKNEERKQTMDGDTELLDLDQMIDPESVSTNKPKGKSTDPDNELHHDLDKEDCFWSKGCKGCLIWYLTCGNLWIGIKTTRCGEIYTRCYWCSRDCNCCYHNSRGCNSFLTTPFPCCCCFICICVLQTWTSCLVRRKCFGNDEDLNKILGGIQ